MGVNGDDDEFDDLSHICVSFAVGFFLLMLLVVLRAEPFIGIVV